ncbi:hypothetical protein [Bradyrhizobium paxllaeri]|uniref:hypothetical protein n=1 Tax=Bradyrhizobium paxllaeri TaxID=190148 RepID=UPI0011479CDC|nr:hypothetical protein [Bradyrhizobium paxllaeri]
MNGMTSRLEATRQIIHVLGIESIVETGTFRGTTAEWFAQFGLPLETVELAERYWAFSRARLAKFANAKIYLQSSVPFLRERIARGSSEKDARQLFYLDSHWENYLPLREELELIFNHYTSAVVLIDDFKVDDDAGYGFDHYAPDKELTLAYVEKSDLPELSCFYPTTGSREETGAKRGWVVLTSNHQMAEQLKTISLLRECRVGK